MSDTYLLLVCLLRHRFPNHYGVVVDRPFVDGRHCMLLVAGPRRLSTVAVQRLFDPPQRGTKVDHLTPGARHGMVAGS